MFERITGDNLLDGDVGSCQEPHNSNQADDDVLERRKRRQALRVKRYNLEERGKDQCQEAAAEWADQWDDKVQLRDQDSKSTWRTKTETDEA